MLRKVIAAGGLLATRLSRLPSGRDPTSLDSGTVDFALNRSVVALDEVVMTGTRATTERRQLGNTMATVRANVIQEALTRFYTSFWPRLDPEH